MADSPGFSVPVSKIVSGGQTGADRAALDWAIRQGIPHGGWCPRGRLAADGPLPLHYNLEETESSGYRQRTKRNVTDSDGTLIVNLGQMGGGTWLTLKLARQQKKPHRVFQLDDGVTDDHGRELADWLRESRILVLNVAGPGESKRPGIYRITMELLDKLVAA